jgi:hypothetical protein
MKSFIEFLTEMADIKLNQYEAQQKFPMGAHVKFVKDYNYFKMGDEAIIEYSYNEKYDRSARRPEGWQKYSVKKFNPKTGKLSDGFAFVSEDYMELITTQNTWSK